MLGCACRFCDGNSLAGIAHFLHGRGRLAARGMYDSSDQQGPYKCFQPGYLHVVVCLWAIVQRYQQAALAVNPEDSR